MLNRRFHGAPRALRRSAVLVRAAVMTLGVAAASVANAAGDRDLTKEASHQVVVQLTTLEAGALSFVVNELRQQGFTVEPIDGIPNRPVYLLQIAPNQPAQDAVDFLNDWHPSPIEFAELNQVVTSDPWLRDPVTKAKLNSVLAIGEDPTCIDESAGCEPMAVKDLLRLKEAHQQSRGEGVRVAILDTGADFDHPDLEPGDFFGAHRDFIDEARDGTEVGAPVTHIEDFGDSSVGHGTHVTGIVHRIAPAAQLMVGRILDPNGIGTTWLTAKGIFWAIDPNGTGQADTGAHVINLSLDTPANTQVLRLAANVVTCNALPDAQVWESDRRRCADEELKAVVVAAAGNDASGSIQMYPAAYSDIPGLMAVAASDNRQKLVRAPAYFTNSGTYVDIAAPGYGILSQFYDGTHATISGTSMAAPIVAGLAALVRRQAPGPNGWTPAAVAIRIRSRAVSMCGPNAPTAFKHVDVAATVGVTTSLGACPLTK